VNRPLLVLALLVIGAALLAAFEPDRRAAAQNGHSAVPASGSGSGDPIAIDTPGPGR